MYRVFTAATAFLAVILLLFTACGNDYTEYDTHVIHNYEVSHHETTTYLDVDNYTERLGSTAAPLIRAEVLQDPNSDDGEPWIIDIYPVQLRREHSSRALVVRVIDDYSWDLRLFALWLSDDIGIFKSWGELVSLEDIAVGDVVDVWGSINYNTNLTINYVAMNPIFDVSMIWIVD